MTDVSIVIVNYRTAALLEDAVASVAAHTSGLSYEIVVVDNASGDEAVIRERLGGRIKYVQLTENVGFGRGNNAGVEVARGRNILFLNPDTVLLNNAVKILSDYLDAHPDAGAVGGNLYTADGAPNASMGRRGLRPGVFMELSYLSAWTLPRLAYGRNFEFNHSGGPLDVGFIVGADLMVRGDVFSTVGGFDPAFFMYAEEVDLCLRIERAGWRVVSIPDAKIVHLEGKSSHKEHQMRMRYESRRIYYGKHYGKGIGRLADLLHRLTIWSRIAGYGLAGRRTKMGEWRSNLRIFNTAK